MPKIYTEQNVLNAAYERIDLMFSEFENIYLSVSGGKDSSVMLQLVAQRARLLGRKFDILYIDLEAQYKATIEHVEELLEDNSDVIGVCYWIALPLSLRNAVSVLQPKWTCWGASDKDKWVRPMPDNQWVINEDNHPFPWFEAGMEFEEFILLFAQWYVECNGRTAAGIGIRSNESFNRFTTIISETKTRYKSYPWTTQVRLRQQALDCFNFYPIYDWETEDIWGAVSRLGLKFNYIYELMYKNGLSIHEQRLCQPYGDDQRNGLDQFKALEPETWEKVLNRVNGVNFGNIYCRTSLLGNLDTEKPKSLTWQQYAIFLLESIRIYAPELEQHYYKKIKTFMKWWYEEKGTSLEEIVDEGDRKSEAEREVASWKRIARAIEKNDFWMKRLSFSATKNDVERLNTLRGRYKKLLGDGKADKDLLRYEQGTLLAK